MIFSIFRNNSYTTPINSSTGGNLLKCIFQTAHNACNSKDVDALKFQLVHHDAFYIGQNQQNSTECLPMLINIIHKGSMPDSSSTTYPIGVSLSDIVLICFWENILPAVYVDWGPPHLSFSLILQGLLQKLQRSCPRCNNNWHVISNYILRPPKYLLLFINRFRYININVTKDRCSIPMDTTVRPGPLKFRLRATIDHHGTSIHSCHYTASIKCCKKNIILQR